MSLDKGPPESSSAPSAVWERREGHLRSRKGALTGHGICSWLGLRLLASRTVINFRCCSQPVCDSFVTVEQMNSDSVMFPHSFALLLYVSQQSIQVRP